jgi:ribosomal protection tetracycline resistance protein
MNELVVGILAHVDAGKTTLSEGMLYQSGTIKKLGRVDHQNAFLDTDAMERNRGITIFSKQAVLPLENRSIILMDTPGHVDFSAEMERTMQVLDYAILVISATDGVQAHTETLWQLLERYQIPTFLFVNKMDLDGADRAQILAELGGRLSEGCLPIDRTSEEVAMCSEELMSELLEQGEMSDSAIARAVANRQLFPCCFGSALRLDGVDEFLSLLETYTILPDYPADFGAQVYKISRDAQGNRLTWLKVTGGVLRPKTMLSGTTNGEKWEEKADQLRIYSGAKFVPADAVLAGGTCAVTGLRSTYAGEGLGFETDAPMPVLESVLNYQIILPDGCDRAGAYAKLRQLEEEDPMLRLIWNAQAQEIHVRLMGKVQLEVLQNRIQERFGLDVTFGPGSIVYKETIAAPVEGVGHFEPLRHYAEVHLLLEPTAPGSGVTFATTCSEDFLDRNWQRLILTHLAEKDHLGVLTGAPITDIRITLLSGRAHVKHTEGGDFREATYRAVRMGLMRAESVLLEPWYAFRLDVPAESVGRAMADIQRFGGECDAPESKGDRTMLSGSAPVAMLADYPADVAAYTKGRGRLSLRFDGYRPCPEQKKLVEAANYNPTADLENSPDSVFCIHGGGFNVKWDEVPEHMHLPWAWQPPKEEEAAPATIRRGSASYSGTQAEDKALQAIFERTYGAVKRRDFTPQRELKHGDMQSVAEVAEPFRDFLLVDGYNIIFAWDDLKALAKEDLDAARNQLIHILCNYQGCRSCSVILVFDAYRMKGNPGRTEQVNNIFVVYTKQAETADSYIERASYELGINYRVRVATSDGLEQSVILGHNAQRISARQFQDEVRLAEAELAERIRRNNER